MNRCPTCNSTLFPIEPGTLYSADPLTERERTVLWYLASSLSTREIAEELYVSLNTVKTHKRGIYRKLGARNRSDAVRRGQFIIQSLTREAKEKTPCVRSNTS